MWNLSTKYKYKQIVNIGIGRHQLYTNAVSDKDIHVITEHKFKTFLSYQAPTRNESYALHNLMQI